MRKKNKGTIECDKSTVTCNVGIVQCENKNKGTTECDKNTITCNVGTMQCEDSTIKCEEKKKKHRMWQKYSHKWYW